MAAYRLRARLATLAVALSLIAAGLPASANDLGPGLVNAADDETASAWFVELTTPPTSDGVSASVVAESKSSFRKAAKSKGLDLAERFEYGDLFNGVSVRASAAEINAIQRLPGVKAVWPVVTEALPKPSADGGETIDLATAIHMTGADYVQDTLGFTGKGIKVAVMDTGIDYDNPDLGGCFGATCRVFTGWDFVGDAYNADSSSLLYSPAPVPDAFPDDCNGHGTHVSGIVGANGVVKGVAPDVRFGAYRVFGCNGSTEADIMLAAMERALADRMDVLNMSIGSAFTWPQYPTAVAADRLVRKHGIVVVASIGNSGASGLYSAGAPGVGEKVIGVASFDNTRVSLRAIQVSGIANAIGYSQASAAPIAPTSGSLELKTLGTTTTANDGCTPMPAGTYAGKAALIRRGTCGFALKAQNAQAAGAAAVILYNNQSGTLTPTVAGTPAVTIPVVMISQVDGNAVWAQVHSTPGTTLTWTAQTVSTASPTGGLISSFSSYGLAPDLSLKPDIGAPGGNIWSTLPLEQGGHGSLSGTSMSSPHVAGAAALLLQALPKAVKDLGLEGIRGFLQNTAEPAVWWGNPALGVLDNVQRQGAGMLNIRAAIEANASVTPGKLALGESQSGPATRTITITDLKGPRANNDAKAVTYTFSHQAALALGSNTFVPTFPVRPALVAFSAPSVTVKKNKSATVDVTITAPSNLVDRGTYGGYIVITGDDGSTYRVPYSGFKGDYQSIPVLTGLAASSRQTGYINSSGAIASTYNTGLAGYSFTMAPKANPGGFGHATFLDIPFYLVHLDHQSRSASFTVYDSTGTTALGEAFPTEDFLPRNSTTTSFFAFGWDGFVGPAGLETMLPNGDYVMKLTLVKALGDPSNPAHVETATFGKVTIARAP